MSKCLVHRDPVEWIEPDHALQQLNSFLGTPWVLFLQVYAFFLFKGFQVVHCLSVTHKLTVCLHFRSPDHIEYNPELVCFLTLAHS